MANVSLYDCHRALVKLRDRSLFTGRGLEILRGPLIFGKSPMEGALIFGKSPMEGALIFGAKNFEKARETHFSTHFGQK